MAYRCPSCLTLLMALVSFAAIWGGGMRPACAGPATLPPSAGNPIEPSRATSPPLRRPAEIALIDRARRHGWIRVIVSLHTDRSDQGIRPQAETALLARLPPGSVRVVSRFRRLAALVAEANVTGIQALLNDPQVVNITEDRLSKPTKPR